MSTQNAELLQELSIAELESLLDGKKAQVVALNQRKQTILGELDGVDKKLEELTGMKPSNLARSAAMKASWERRRKKSKTPVQGSRKARPGSLLTVLLEVLGQTGVYMSLDTLAEEVIAAGWRGRGGKVPKNLKGSIYGTIYAYKKSGGHVSYDKATKTYSI